MKKIFFVIGVFLNIYSFAYCQTRTCQRLYNGQYYNSSDNGRGLCETTNGNMYLTAREVSQAGIRTEVLKLKPSGDTIWVKFLYKKLTLISKLN